MNEATKPLTVGSLFSGIGGFDLGLERVGMQVKWQVEINKWCQRVLAKHWPDIQKYGDIKQIDWEAVEPVDLICGGFPCQPFSLAGKRGEADDARNMWPEYRRCVEALRPTWVLGENVSGAKRYIQTICKSDLEALGYRVRVFGIPACAVGAPHQRKRFWIVARYEQGCRCPADGSFRTGPREEIGDTGIFPDPLRLGQQEQREPISLQQRGEFLKEREAHRSKRIGGWPPEPRVCRMAHGIPHRVDRLGGLGNSVVPQIVEFIGRCINASHRA